MNKKIKILINQIKMMRWSKIAVATILIIFVLTTGIIIEIFVFLPRILNLISIFVILIVAFLAIKNFWAVSRLHLKIKQETQSLQALIENLKDGIIIYNPNFKILKINKALEEMLGIEANELINRQLEPKSIKIEKLKTAAQLIFPSLASSIRQISPAGQWPQIIEINVEKPEMNLITTLHRVFDQNNKLIAFIKIVKDKTREKSIIQAKSSFLNTAAHQLRTPLTALNWALENINNIAQEKSPEIEILTKEALQTSQRTLKIVNDLLDASQIEEGRFGYNFEETDLIEFIKEIIASMEIFAKQYSVKIYFNQPPENKIKAKIDRRSLAIALTNLLDNAIRYNTKNGRVIVSVNITKAGSFVKIAVEDTGIGISPEDLKNLFQKFWRSKNIAQIEPNGSGLGLYITKNIIKRHGGEIGAESILGRGSTFWFTLSLKPELIPKKELITEDEI